MSGFFWAGLSIAGIALVGVAVACWRHYRLKPKFSKLKFDSSQFFEHLVDTANDIIYILSPEKEILFLNHAFETLTGWTRREWLGKPFLSLLHPDDAESSVKRLESTARGGTPKTQRLRVRTKSGAYLIGEFNTSFITQNQHVGGYLGSGVDITARLQMEQNLIQKERFLFEVFESIQDGVSVLDTELNVLRVNSAMEKLYSHVRPLIGRKCYRVYHNRTEPCAVCPCKDTLRTGKASYAVVPFVNENGDATGSVELHTFPLMDSATGQLKGVIEFVRDISSRIKAAEALRESRQMSADIMQSIPSGLMIFQHQSPDLLIFLEANPEAERLVKLNSQKFMGKEFEEVWPKAKQTGLKDAFLKVMESGEPFVEEELHYRDDRIEVFFIFHAFRMPGRRLGLAFENITEKKMAEQAMMAAEAKFRSLVEHSLVGIYIIQEGMFQYVNPRMAEIFGYTVSAMQGMPGLDAVVHPTEVNLVQDTMQQLFSQETHTGRFRLRGVRKDGHEILCEVHGSVTEINGQSAIIGTLLDVTESKHLEEQLRQSQKMEAVGRLAGSVAHDFNNLLMAILGFSELVLNRPGLDPRAYQDVEEVIKAAQRGGAVTRQLLAYSRRQVLQVRELDLNQVIFNMQKMLSHLIGEDIKLALELEPDLEAIKADLVNLEQVIMNLAVNARDAMPEGGRLLFKTSRVEITPADTALMPESRTGKFICLSVEDTGRGIDAEILPSIFEPFFTTKEVGLGTGLGLAVVYGIVKQHEGWLQVSSIPEQGTTFKIYWPACATCHTGIVQSKPVRSLAEYQGRQERILVIEDEEQVLEFSSRALQECGYVVFKAHTAKEALEIFRNEKGRLHLILSDVVLPDKNGLKLIEELRNENPDLKVILSSGYADSKAQWTQIQGRGIPFLQKPYSLAELLQTIRSILTPSA
jgi:PAS domain S-box-containing protein